MTKEKKLELIEHLKRCKKHIVWQHKKDQIVIERELLSINSAINKLNKSIKLDNLIYFCNTGKFQD
jgi:predicted translin family RNA/ssDNA-binding protein